VLTAVGWAAAAYFWLTWSDWLALRYVGRRIAYPRIALASFIALSIGHNLGFAAVSSGAIRYRFYSRAGLGAEEVAKVIVFCGTTLLLGLCALAGLSLLWRPDLAEGVAGLGGYVARLAGVVCLAVVGGYLALAATVRGERRLWRWTIEMPPLGLAVAQIPVGALNLACQAACLHAVIGAAAEVGYFETASVYVLATAAAIVSHVPGGLGVIESIVLYLLPGENLVGPVLVFRFVFFLLPLCLGGLLFAAVELKLGARRIAADRGAGEREALQE
jgi:uncharacterized membrane protein YbhN (UPF0104 family)